MYMLRRLRNTRNLIHVNLMISLFLRGLTFFLHMSRRRNMYLDETYTGSMIMDAIDTEYCDRSLTMLWCRLITTLDYWAMTATFYWLLIEGIQLYTLLVVTILSVKKYFYSYLIFGWGVSWLSIITWVIVKIKYENNGCWEMYDRPFFIWIIRGPILSSILVCRSVHNVI